MQEDIDQALLTREEILHNFWDLIHRAADHYADRDYVVTPNGALSLGEANRQANVVYQAISGLGLERQTGVGLFLKDPLSMVPSLLGVMKANDYHVPLDTTFPEATLRYMIEVSGIGAMLTDSQLIDQIRPVLPDHVSLINIDDLDFSIEAHNPVIHHSPDDIVQIIFTSGSTGRPKGVIEDYRYIAHGVHTRLNTHHLEAHERVLRLASFSFGGIVAWVLAAPLMPFVTYLYSVKAEGFVGLKEWINEQQITYFYSLPTVFRGFMSTLSPEDRFPSVRRVSSGGEKKLRADFEDFRVRFPNARTMRFGFASQETGPVSVVHFPMDHRFADEVLPAGHPLDDLEVLLWDEHDNAVPPGEEGEIIVHGDALARGYINNPELTLESFLPDPERPGWQYYRTGDLGKFLPDGQLQHLGRIDHMVKIKGVRIELSSIEGHLLAYPGVVQAACKAVEDANVNQKLVAYFVAEPGITVPISDVRKFLADQLPQHLLPHFLVQLEAIPQTISGKVNYRQLPVPDLVRPPLSYDYVAPSTDLERTLVRLWEEAIGISGIGVTDDFFDVGGDSLIGVLLFVKIEEELNRSLPVSVLLTANTIRKQAALIQAGDQASAFTGIIPVREKGDTPPLFFIPGKGGVPTRIRHLEKRIEPGVPIYALQDLLEETGPRPLRSIEAVAAFYLQQIRKVVPPGPYFLVGESVGGKVAYEMAQQLLRQGEQVPILAMLDTYNFSGHVLRPGGAGGLRYHLMLIGKHISILFRSDRQGRREYLQFYRETLGEKLKRWGTKRFGGASSRNQVALPENIRRIEEAIKDANRAYMPQPYPGRVLLFKALRGPDAYEPTNGWDQVEVGELIVHPLDCYHGSILFEPAVSEVAETLQNYIDEFQRESGSTNG